MAECLIYLFLCLFFFFFFFLFFSSCDSRIHFTDQFIKLAVLEQFILGTKNVIKLRLASASLSVVDLVHCKLIIQTSASLV